jgi:3'-5' exoribonuclease
LKLTSIKDFKEGNPVQGFFLCREKNLRTTKVGDYYLDILMQDTSGRIGGKIWDNIDHYRQQFEAGDPVAIKGIVERFNGVLQLNCSHIALATKERYGRYGYSEDMLVPVVEEDRKAMWADLRKLVSSIKNKPLKRLVKTLLAEHKEILLLLPGSTAHHHPERGGLLSHMLSTGRIASQLAGHYDYIDDDLVLAGILLHDIGKVIAMSTSLQPGYTTEGQLAGHVVLGWELIRSSIAGQSDFPEKLAMQIEHIVLAHEGNLPNTSSPKPRFPEALMVQFIDTMDGQIDLMRREIINAPGDEEFTDKHNHFRRNLWTNYSG